MRAITVSSDTILMVRWTPLGAVVELLDRWAAASNEFNQPCGRSGGRIQRLVLWRIHLITESRSIRAAAAWDVSWGSNGIIGSYGDGANQFRDPMAIAVDADGNLFVADTGKFPALKSIRATVNWIPHGARAVSWRRTAAEQGSFHSPTSAVMDSRGRTYVADVINFRIARYTRGGVLDTAWGSGGYIGTGTQGSDDDAFNIARYVAVDSDDNLYVSDSINNRIKRYTSAGRAGHFVGDGRHTVR